MEIRTARLLLRRARPDDIDALHAMLSDARAMRYMSSLPHERIEQTAEWMDELLAPQGGEKDLFLVEHDGRVIGRLGIWKLPEIGLIFHPDAWGQGFASEAMRAYLDHVFATTDATEVTADVDPRNHKSLKLLQKLGFAVTGEAQNTFHIGGEWAHSVYLALKRPG